MRAVVKAAADKGVEYVADAPEPKAVTKRRAPLSR